MRSSRRTACGQEQEQEQEQALAGQARQVRTFQVPDSQGDRRQAQLPESACLALLSLPPSPSLPLRLQGDWSSKRYDLLLLVGRTHRTSHHCPRRHLPTVLCFKLLVSQHADIPSLFSLTIHSLNDIAAAAMITTEPRPTRVFTRRQIEGLIAAGDTLVIADSHVLRLNAWQDLHPGGRLVIQHMVGRDATDELAMYVVHWRAAL